MTQGVFSVNAPNPGQVAVCITGHRNFCDPRDMTVNASIGYSPYQSAGGCQAGQATAGLSATALKDCVLRILLQLAVEAAPDTYCCVECRNAAAPACDGHSAQAADAERLVRAVEMAALAQTRRDIDAALAYACAGDPG